MKEITKKEVEQLPLQVEETKPEKAETKENLIELAIKEKVDVGVLERLLAMQEKVKSERAKEEYFLSMKNLQAEMPDIKRDAIIKNKNGGIRYKYATLDTIISQTKGLIAKWGFSYQFAIEHKEKSIVVSCIVNHIAGHTEKTSVEIPFYNDEYNSMNNIQEIGATITYGKRYAFCNAFGIALEGEDTDANINRDENNLDKKAELFNSIIKTDAGKIAIENLKKEKGYKLVKDMPIEELEKISKTINSDQKQETRTELPKPTEKAKCTAKLVELYELKKRITKKLEYEYFLRYVMNENGLQAKKYDALTDEEYKSIISWCEDEIRKEIENEKR